MTDLTRRMVRTAAACGFAFALIGSALAEPLSKAKKGDWPMWGGSPDRNMVSGETGMPAAWDVKSGTNLKWKAGLGSQSYGNPVVVDGKIFIGTNNNGNYRQGITGDKGVILCFKEETGEMLWQATHDKLPTGRVNDWPEQGICSSPSHAQSSSFRYRRRAISECRAGQ